MNFNDTDNTHLFLDRPLENVDHPEQLSSEDGHSLIDLVSDGRAELLDSLLQILLAVCLLSSFAVCGWRLSVGTASPNVAARTQAAVIASRSQPDRNDAIATARSKPGEHRAAAPRSATVL